MKQKKTPTRERISFNRIKITLSPNTETIPFDYTRQQMGLVYGWLDESVRKKHDNASLFSYSPFLGESTFKHGVGLQFPKGAIMYINDYDQEGLVKTHNNINAIKSIVGTCKANFGMVVESATIETVFVDDDVKIVNAPSGVFLLDNPKGGTPKPLYANDDSDRTEHLLTKSVLNKAECAGLKGDLRVFFFPPSEDKKIKLRNVVLGKNPNVYKKVCMHQIVMMGDAHMIAFAMQVGVGKNSGMGLGYLHERTA
jgi:CRISPR/Cas system endoribonuclease Cas6 (RAMP superfamily)